MEPTTENKGFNNIQINRSYNGIEDRPQVDVYLQSDNSLSFIRKPSPKIVLVDQKGVSNDNKQKSGYTGGNSYDNYSIDPKKEEVLKNISSSSPHDSPFASPNKKNDYAWTTSPTIGTHREKRRKSSNKKKSGRRTTLNSSEKGSSSKKTTSHPRTEVASPPISKQNTGDSESKKKIDDSDEKLREKVREELKKQYSVRKRLEEDERHLSTQAFFRIMSTVSDPDSSSQSTSTTKIDTMPEIDGYHLSSIRTQYPNNLESEIHQKLLRHCVLYMLSKAKTSDSCEFVIPEFVPGGLAVPNFARAAKILCSDLNSRPGISAHIIPNSVAISIKWSSNNPNTSSLASQRTATDFNPFFADSTAATLNQQQDNSFIYR